MYTTAPIPQLHGVFGQDPFATNGHRFDQWIRGGSPLAVAFAPYMVNTEGGHFEYAYYTVNTDLGVNTV